jgi:hypothetical protein
MTVAPRRFTGRVLAAVDQSKILGIRAGRSPHRVIGVWVVVVEGRVFVRSWGLTAGGWYRTFAAEPQGIIEVGARQIRVRARPVRSERLITAVDEAYRRKYATPGSVKWVRGLCRGRRRASTTELLPLD